MEAEVGILTTVRAYKILSAKMKYKRIWYGDIYFIYPQALNSLMQMSLDVVNSEDDRQDLLFAQLSVDTVYASYAAAQNRVRQYTQLLALLKREEELWAQKVEKARLVLPEYKSRFALNFQEA
jgi:hypothetical protein